MNGRSQPGKMGYPNKGAHKGVCERCGSKGFLLSLVQLAVRSLGSKAIREHIKVFVKDVDLRVSF